MNTCPHCSDPFEPKRADQVYCRPKCRQAHYQVLLGDGGRRAKVSSVRKMARGGVSIVLRFNALDAHNALRLNVGEVVDVVGSEGLVG